MLENVKYYSVNWDSNLIESLAEHYNITPLRIMDMIVEGKIKRISDKKCYTKNDFFEVIAEDFQYTKGLKSTVKAFLNFEKVAEMAQMISNNAYCLANDYVHYMDA